MTSTSQIDNNVQVINSSIQDNEEYKKLPSGESNEGFEDFYKV